MSSFSAALVSGQLGPLMSQFGLGEDVANAAAEGGMLSTNNSKFEPNHLTICQSSPDRSVCSHWHCFTFPSQWIVCSHCFTLQTVFSLFHITNCERSSVRFVILGAVKLIPVMFVLQMLKHLQKRCKLRMKRKRRKVNRRRWMKTRRNEVRYLLHMEKCFLFMVSLVLLFVCKLNEESYFTENRHFLDLYESLKQLCKKISTKTNKASIKSMFCCARTLTGATRIFSRLHDLCEIARDCFLTTSVLRSVCLLVLSVDIFPP